MIKKILLHFYTITKHRHLVMNLCFKVGLYKQGMLHDLSKYSFTEFFNSVKYYTGTKSPISLERQNKGYSIVFLHHKGHNKHHWEYWFDPYTKNRHTSMPDKYLIESILDRIAAAKVYLKEKYTNSSPYEYFLNDVEITNYMLKDEYDRYAYLLLYLKEYGENKLLEHLKEIIKREYIIK